MPLLPATTHRPFRRSSLRFLVAGLLLPLVPPWHAHGQPTYLEGLKLKSQGKPNIIVVVATGAARADLDRYQPGPSAATNLDRLAVEGMRFTQFYAGGSSPRAARLSLLTGEDTRQLAPLLNQAAPLASAPPTVASRLKSAGYVTGAIGVWALGDAGSTSLPNRVGFDDWLGFLDLPSSSNAFPQQLWRNERPLPLPGNAAGKQRQDAHRLLTTASVNFIRVNKNRPFLLYLAPPAFTNAPAPNPSPDTLPHLARLDETIGQLLQALRDAAIDQDTLLLFTSDSSQPSGPDGKRPHAGLQDRYLRVPLIARWPGQIPQGRTNTMVCAAWDVLPTATELAKVKPDSRTNRVSLVPALLGRAQTNLHDHLRWEIPGPPPQQALRRDHWKAHRNSPDQPVMLFDLRNDPDEAHDVAAANSNVAADLKTLLDRP